MNSRKSTATTPPSTPGSPRFVDGPPLVFAGLRQSFTAQTRPRIPELWQRFAPHLGRIEGQIGDIAYGVVSKPAAGSDAAFDYMAAVEIKPGSALPPDFVQMRVPAQRYATFVHDGHVSTLNETVHAAFESLSRSAHPPVETAGLPSFFERYSEAFDPSTGEGGIELWVPVRS
jgi:AraC family transcriptional regulator